MNMSVATFKMSFYPSKFIVGHFGLQIMALMGKFPDRTWSFWNQHTKISVYTNFYTFIINLNNPRIYVLWLTIFLQNNYKSWIWWPSRIWKYSPISWINVQTTNISFGTFKMRFYPLNIKLYEKYTFLKSAILDCKLWASWTKSRMGPDRFEISVPKLSCVPIFMLLSLIWTIMHFFGL